jgi:hypothetical protein
MPFMAIYKECSGGLIGKRCISTKTNIKPTGPPIFNWVFSEDDVEMRVKK